MKYEYAFQSFAQNELEESLYWYLERSPKAALQFQEKVRESLELICNHPYRWKRIHKNFREIPVRNFPFSLIYFIEPAHRRVILVSVFHHKRNPDRKPK